MNYKERMVDAIGNTPLIKLNNLMEAYHTKSSVFVKLERSNPTGSIKDRAAKEMLLDAMKRGEVDRETVVVEPTSGNTGIGLAAVCASLGLKCVLFMPSNCSIERVKMMKAFGADIRLTDPKKGGMAETVREAKEYLASLKKGYMPMQFSNKDNSLAHYKTTGPEIYEALDGKVDYFISAFGTGGTLTGVSKFLKEKNKDVKAVGVEPATSPLISEGHAGGHKIQGIGANFKPEVLELNFVDKVDTVSNEDAYEFARELARKEGIFAGISSGANVAEAIKIAQEVEGKNIVTVLPDDGERYLSVEGLFEA